MLQKKHDARRRATRLNGTRLLCVQQNGNVLPGSIFWLFTVSIWCDVSTSKPFPRQPHLSTFPQVFEDEGIFPGLVHGEQLPVRHPAEVEAFIHDGERFWTKVVQARKAISAVCEMYRLSICVAGSLPSTDRSCPTLNSTSFPPPPLPLLTAFQIFCFAPDPARHLQREIGALLAKQSSIGGPTT